MPPRRLLSHLQILPLADLAAVGDAEVSIGPDGTLKRVPSDQSEAQARGSADAALQAALAQHAADTANPHQVTASQTGATTTAAVQALIDAATVGEVLRARMGGASQTGLNRGSLDGTGTAVTTAINDGANQVKIPVGNGLWDLHWHAWKMIGGTYDAAGRILFHSVRSEFPSSWSLTVLENTVFRSGWTAALATNGTTGVLNVTIGGTVGIQRFLSFGLFRRC